MKENFVKVNKIGWYDIKTKFKSILRNLVYSRVFQYFVARLINLYLRFVLLTSKKVFLGTERCRNLMSSGQAFIGVAWHNRIALSHNIFVKANKNMGYKYSVVASAHGDGLIIANVMKMFNIDVIFGSTQKKGSSKKGINMANFRKIFKVLKSEKKILCLTPDGPRGPRFEVGGEVASIAKMTSSKILAISYSISRRKILNSWDKFIFPLPFSKICFCLGDVVEIKKNASEDDLKKANEKIKEAINAACIRADEEVGVEKMN